MAERGPEQRRTAAYGLRHRLMAIFAIAVFLAVPFLVFRATVEDAATDFRFELVYLVSGWGPWVLIVIGSLCFVPVAISMGRSAYSRWALSPGIRRANYVLVEDQTRDLDANRRVYRHYEYAGLFRAAWRA